MDDKRTIGIIVTVVTALLCGCPGLISMCAGALAVVGVYMPESEVVDPNSALIGAGIFVCAGLIAVVIPLVAGVVTLRASKTAPGGVIDFDEPLPPAI